MKIRFATLLLLSVLFACSKRPANTAVYPKRDYITVGKMIDSVKPPYVIDARNGNKRIVFIGCDHNRDAEHPQVNVIAKYFDDLKPQITFNEGGQIADTIHFASLKEAAQKRGETGVLKYLSDQAHIKMMDGDMADSAEFKVMLKRYPKDKLLLYYVMERLAVPYLSGAYGTQPFDDLYKKAIVKWFVLPGLPLTKEEQAFAYFKNTYKKHIGHDFKLSLNPDVELFDYVNNNCEFCALGRSSKMVRDSTLLDKIAKALDRYNRVLITFGHGHALALEPALQQMIVKK